MNRNLYSNIEFSKLVERINREVKRRGTFRWWDPFMSPTVGQDRTNAISLPTNGIRVEVTNKTYTINNPSKGSIEETRNIEYEKQGFNPAGQKPDKNKSFPNTSASRFDVDEIKNMLVGLSKIRDISLFYGRDEQAFLAFRDHKGIDILVKEASKDKLNVPLHESPNKHTKMDPNNGVTNKQSKDYPNSYLEVEFPKENNQYVMPSGEFDGEECLTIDGPNEKNFYDDYGAKPGEINHKSLNPYISPVVDRSWHDQDDDRNEIYQEVKPGGRSSNRFGETPRNPQKGDPYPSRPVYGGAETTCNNACSGICSVTCDNECSESCTSTCFNRCGNACTNQCQNVCTGCTTLCYTSCSSKCEQNVGYSCLKAGAKAVHITTSGGRDGIPAKNEITSEIYTCTACSFTCQFYPNKKTECWDSACMGMCFTSCMHSCSTSCFGGCIDNENQNKGDFKTGIGRGCSSGCTANCIGICRGTCVGNCVSSCFHGCQSSCFDNCMRTCSTSCGSGCQSGCTTYCVNRCTSCTGTCSGVASALQTYCADNGCTMNCMQGCNKNCVGIGCKSICGTESAGACEANCRLSCMNASCTAMCSDQCASYCTSCVNGCNFQCGACSSRCATGCESACNINCTKECQHSCSINCLNSCKDDCGSCSSLCYSCVGMCIGVCSVKCQAGCSSCANNCSWWCDTSCNQACFSNCSNQCISTCSGSCATFLTSETTTYLDLPERPPTAEGYKYPHPKNRWEQRESFKLVHDEEYFEEKPVEPGEDPFIPKEQETRILITINKEKNMDVICKDGELDWEVKYATLHGGVFDINQDTGEILINEDAARNLMKQLHFENTDKKQSILAVIIHPKEDYEFTKKDVSHKLPFGYISINSVFLENGDFVSIIQRLRNYL